MSRGIKIFSILLLISTFTAGCAAASTPQEKSAEPTLQPTTSFDPLDQPVSTAKDTEPAPPPIQVPEKDLLPEESPPPGAEGQFSTDFSIHSIPYSEILSGGPPKDGIPAISSPQFATVDEADKWLEPVEPVIHLQINGDVKAYPIQILIWHEIVNDTLGGTPVSVTFCPLCNTAIAFDRSVNGQILDFGTTGRLRYSNLIMYDRQTETWWQQANGEAIAGELTGTQLEYLAATIIPWDEFKSNYPQGQVLSRDTGFNRAYGQNPYAGYDDVNQPPFLYRGPETPGSLPPVARVLTLELNGETVAYPYDVLEKLGLVQDTLGGVDIVVFWTSGTASALDASSVASGRDVGAAAAFLSTLGEQPLEFVWEEPRILDQDTRSEWDILGKAISGDLAGKQLTPIVSVNHFWFSWAVFKPDTRVFQP